jgi:exopolysaccharide biosynthesis polyprenyl glycosylphosphotransferase
MRCGRRRRNADHIHSWEQHVTFIEFTQLREAAGPEVARGRHHAVPTQRIRPNLRTADHPTLPRIPAQSLRPAANTGPATPTRVDPSAVDAPLARAAAAVPAGDTVAGDWRVRFTQAAIGVDLLAAGLAIVPTALAHSGGSRAGEFSPAWFAMPLLWVTIVASHRTYERRFVGVGTDEFVRILRAGLTLLAVIAIAAYVVGTDPTPGDLMVAVPTTVALDLLGRCALRAWLHRQRAQGRCVQRTLLVGSAGSIPAAVTWLSADRTHGMAVVGGWATDPAPPVAGSDTDADEENSFSDAELAGLVDAVREYGAELVAALPSARLSGTALRRLAWSLEPTAAELVVSPGLIEVVGARLSVRPVANSPMLHVSQAKLSGPARVTKATFDRAGATIGLILITPVLIGIAVWIWAGDRRSPIFRQTRVGRGGREFTLYKFRTMVPDAEHIKVDLADQNETDGLLFKMRSDPRVTAAGRCLRRYSLDELPQLINVMAGQMSLVGPRPPLPEEVQEYADDMRRRLLVRPGLTGLWQVSGRSDLSWAESVRLDLRYVENWSLGFDLLILWRTARAVIGRSGAY